MIFIFQSLLVYKPLPDVTKTPLVTLSSLSMQREAPFLLLPTQGSDVHTCSLIDSGASHNFILPQLVLKLQGHHI